MTSSSDEKLIAAVEALYSAPQRNIAAVDLLTTVRNRLTEGTVRVAEPFEEESGAWRVNVWVKKAMLLMNALGQPGRVPANTTGAGGIELDTTPWQAAPPPHCRMPAGSLVREGAHIGKGVMCMPPSVLQLGCHLGEGAIVDSMVMVGLGAQVGAGAQLSCGAIVGGYLVPLEHPPTIVESGVLMGSNSAVFDGARIGAGALLLAGTQIVPSLGLYDLRTEAMVPLEQGILRVPPRAIVGMGTRPIGAGGVHLQTAVILGIRHGAQPKDWELFTDLPPAAGS